MSKIDQAKNILKNLGLPEAQQNEMSALTLLALCGIKPKDNWASASRVSLKVTKGIMAFIKKEYKKTYAPNTRETVRRQVLHQFIQALIVDQNPDNPFIPGILILFRLGVFFRVFIAYVKITVYVLRVIKFIEFVDQPEHFKCAVSL